MMQKSKFKQLINPHSHTHYSLDGAATVEQVIDRNIELNAPYVAVTEHGNINSAVELYTIAHKKNIKPILGIEAYMINPFHQEYVELYRKAYLNGHLKLRAKDPEKIEKELHNKAMNQYLHVTIHFKDEWAYKYFMNLSHNMWSRSIKKYDEVKPMITIEELEQAAGHITITSSCLRGPVQSFLLPSKDGIITPDFKRAEYMYHKLKEIAGKDSFYIEIFPHRITHEWKKPEIDPITKNIIKPGYFVPNECTCYTPDGDLQKIPNLFCLRLAQKYNDKPIISLDSHYAWEKQKKTQDAKLGNGTEQWRFYNLYHIMSTDEAAKILQSQLQLADKDIEQFVDNSYHFASHFDNFKIHTKKDRFILEAAPENWLQRITEAINRHNRMDWNNAEMVDRLKKEINILANNGTINLMPYFFIVEDVANYCRENNILMTVRGSAGGSLLLYLLGVSAVNPLKHNLSFERFLTEGRIRSGFMPDVDSDLSDQESVFNYLEKKYGDRFCRLSTDTMLKLKSSIKDAERSVFGHVRSETEKLCNKLPSTPQGVDDKKFVIGYIDEDGNKHEGLIFTNPELKKYAIDNPEIWKMVLEMMGIQRNKGVHACGVVIADKPITEYSPVIYVNETKVTGYSPKSIEEVGLIKYDFLGLNTLRDIQDCLHSIKERLNISIDPWNLPYDPECFEMFTAGRTETVFQFDTETVKPYLMQIKPKNIDDLAAITALCRPGTLDAPSGDGRTLAEVYVARAKGEPITYIHPDLEPILNKTYGIQLTQEQTLQIFRDIGGFTYEEAETARRAIGKKDEALLESVLNPLRETCLKKGWTENQANLLIDQIKASARYSFNYSHAVAYAYIAYACMYLKTKYKLDWWKAILSNASKEEFATKFWQYVQDFTVLPDINKSGKEFKIVGDQLICPISILTGIGPKGYEQLTSNAPYRSLRDFLQIHLGKRNDNSRSAITQPIVEKLIVAGILDSLYEQDYPQATKVEQKIEIFNTLMSEIRNEWAKKINPIYIGMTELDRYLIKKQLVPVYSIDIRKLLLSQRGGRIVNGNCYLTVPEDPNLMILDGNQLYDLKDKFTNFKYTRLLPPEKRYYGVIGYILQERAKPYRNKSKQATVVTFDCNGYFFTDILWPKYNESQAPMKFKKMPCLIIYEETATRFSISRIQPLIDPSESKVYDDMV